MSTSRGSETGRFLAGLVLIGLMSGCIGPADHMTRGVKFENEGNLEAAAGEYSNAIALSPDRALGYFYRACVERKRGNLEAAEADFNRAIAIDPTSDRYHLARAHVRLLREDFPGSIQDFTQVLILESEAAEAYLGRAAGFKALGEYDRALEDLDMAVALDPYSVPALFMRGRLKFEEEDFSGARDDFEHVARLDPKSAAAFYNCGLARERLGDFRSALADYETASRLSPRETAKDDIRRRLSACRSRLLKGEGNPAAGVPRTTETDDDVRLNPDPSDLFPEWPDSPPEGGGVSAEILSRILSDAPRVRGLGSLIVVHRNHLVLEACFDGRSRHDLRPLCSATKGLLALLVGVAVREGFIDGLDQKVPDLLVVSPSQEIVVVTTGILEHDSTPKELRKQAEAILRFIRRNVVAAF